MSSGEPTASRPYMPGYGIVGPDEGTGLLPWSWAVQGLDRAHDYWVATVRPDGRPHVMPVWGLWRDGSLWFSSGGRSRKTRNLTADERCVVTTDDAVDPVVLEGSAERVNDADELSDFLAALNQKYSTDCSLELVDPKTNATFRVRPNWAFGLIQDDFAGSPTRWVFQS